MNSSVAGIGHICAAAFFSTENCIFDVEVFNKTCSLKLMMMMMMNRMDPTNHLKCFYLKKARKFCIKLLCKDGGDSILRKKA
jgi:hypothetical protein